jgi:hypothetical protein
MEERFRMRHPINLDVETPVPRGAEVREKARCGHGNEPNQ